MTYFRETQLIPTWAIVLLVSALLIPTVLTVATGTGKEAWITVGITSTILMVIAYLFGVMHTEVREDHVYVGYGIRDTFKYRFYYRDIEKLEARKYSPLGDYGGWGIKGFDNKRVLNARGDRGVELTIRRPGEKRPLYMMIGSQQPEKLERAIEEARERAFVSI